MDADEFTKDLRAMLNRRGFNPPASLRDNVLGVVSVRRPSRLGAIWRSASQFGGAVVVTSVAVATLGGVIVLGMAARGSTDVPGAAGASAVPSAGSASAVPFCGDAIRVVRLGHSGSAVTFTDPATGAVERLVFPSSLRTRVIDGRGELGSNDGRVIGTEGDVLTLGGAAGRGVSAAFTVCTINAVTYALP